MSFDRPYPKRKDRRRPYHGTARHDRGCRPGGSCDWCRRSRRLATLKAEARARDLEANS